MTDNIDIAAILEEGIAAGIAESGLTEEGHKRRAGELAKAFNEASILLEGLEALKNRPLSRFKYEVTERYNEVYISTNVNAVEDGGSYKLEPRKVHITVNGNGQITGYGDDYKRWNGAYDVHKFTIKSENVAEVLKFVAKKAAKRGLVI